MVSSGGEGERDLTGQLHRAQLAPHKGTCPQTTLVYIEARRVVSGRNLLSCSCKTPCACIHFVYYLTLLQRNSPPEYDGKKTMDLLMNVQLLQLIVKRCIQSTLPIQSKRNTPPVVERSKSYTLHKLKSSQLPENKCQPLPNLSIVGEKRQKG